MIIEVMEYTVEYASEADWKLKTTKDGWENLEIDVTGFWISYITRASLENLPYSRTLV